MKIGILTKVLREKPFEEALAQLKDVGYQAISLGSAGMSNNEDDHCNAGRLLANPDEYKRFTKLIDKYGMEATNILVTANPVHPQKSVAQQHDKELREAILLAEKMGIDRICTFSGCPGDHEGALYPNWISYSWPYDFSHVLKWQWEEVLVPYWRDLTAFARKHNVHKIAMEFHPGFCVFNPRTLLKLREAVGPEIGVCLDVSHLFWMGMDPVVVIEKLKDCIWQVHAKDATIRPHKMAENGVFELEGRGDLLDRSWYFSIPGYGHDMQVWKTIVETLRIVGYEGDLSVEHEDSLMGRDEGIRKAFEFLSQVVLEEPAANCRWTDGMKESRFPHLP